MSLHQIIANASSQASDFPWMGLVNYGALGFMVGWFMWRDNRDSKERRKQIQALEGCTQALMVAVLAIKNLDKGITDLALKVKGDSESRSNNEDSNR